jgi:hypothetical protein
MKSYQQVVGQLGGSPVNSKLITAEEAAVIVDELEATAPPVHQHYPDDVAIAVRSALTDAELFISYNMPAKAFEPLVAACAQAPHDLRLNQRLAALHTRASRFAEAAVCCRTLQNVYSEAEYPEEATRYGELADRYEERASAKTHDIEEDSQTVADFAVGDSATAVASEAPASRTSVPWPATPNSATTKADIEEVAEFSVVDESAASTESPVEATAEIDLSDWEDSITVEGDSPAVGVAETDVADSVGDHELPGAAALEIIDEMRFYLSHGMPEQARAALPKLEALTQDAALIAQLRQEVEAAVKATAAKSKEAAKEKEKDKEKEKGKAVAKALPKEEVAIPDFAVEESSIEAPAIEEISAEDIPSLETVSAVEESIPVAELPAIADQPVHPAAEIRAQAPPEDEELPAEDVPFEQLPVAEAPVTLEAAIRPSVDLVVSEPTVTEPVVAEAAVAEPAPAAPLQEFVADLEASLGDFAPPAAHVPPSVEIPVATAIEATPEAAKEVPAPVASAPEPVVHAAAAETEVTQPAPVLGDFVADLEASLGDDFLKAAPLPPEALPAPAITQAASAPVITSTPAPTPAMAPPLAASAAASASSAHGTHPPQNIPAPVAAAAPHIPVSTPLPAAVTAPVAPPAAKATSSLFGEEAGIDLNEMFGELKQDLESGISSTEEDPETHYNLGVAFREMGLLDEAIGELQKTCQSIDRGRPFSQTMQAYTWLAQCFLDKGVPEAATRWYDKALAVPGIDGETRIALHYELGSAFETAGDKPSALKHFMNVYGSNIDYRDVAERIKALKS